MGLYLSYRHSYHRLYSMISIYGLYGDHLIEVIELVDYMFVTFYVCIMEKMLEIQWWKVRDNRMEEELTCFSGPLNTSCFGSPLFCIEIPPTTISCHNKRRRKTRKIVSNKILKGRQDSCTFCPYNPYVQRQQQTDTKFLCCNATIVSTLQHVWYYFWWP